MDKKLCKCPHHSVGAIVIALVALAYLLSTLGVISWYTFQIILPILVIAAAGTKAARGWCSCCND